LNLVSDVSDTSATARLKDENNIVEKVRKSLTATFNFKSQNIIPAKGEKVISIS